MTEPRRLVCFLPLPAPSAEETLRAAPDVALTALTYEAPADEVWRHMARAQGLIVSAARHELPKPYHVTEALLARCPELLAVSSTGAGYDTIDLAACTARGIIAVNQAGANKEAVAEHALGMLLMLAKRIGEADRRLRRSRGFQRVDFMGTDILGKTIGLIGIGHIGTRMAALCGTLFGMRVLAVDPYLDGQEIARRGAEPVDLPTLLAESDVVSVHCPLTAETRGMLGAAQFAKMKPGAFFINTARGGIHDEAALAAALASGRIAGAGLDVWDEEPPPLSNPLLAFDNVVATPHTAGVTRESRDNVGRQLALQMLGIFRGERPPRLLNPEAWDAFQARYRQAFGEAR